MDKPAMRGAIDNVGMRTSDFAVEVGTVTSTDGTAIAYERSGEGPPMMVLGGGLNAAVMFTPLVTALSEHFTVYNYDRRGRGLSGDGDHDQYKIDIEVDDLAAVAAAAGEDVCVFANCTGGMLAVLAAARGVPMRKMALYEPPYCAPIVSDEYMSKLRGHIGADRRTEAVSLFQREWVGFDEQTVANFKHHPLWPQFEAIAPTLYYDSIIGNEHGSIPFDRLPNITVPVLVIGGGASPGWMQEACQTLAANLPNGRYTCAEGEGHILNQKKTAPVVTEFFSS